MQARGAWDSLRILGGYAIFLAWALGVFYSRMIWPAAGRGWLGVVPLSIVMGVSGIVGLVLAVTLACRLQGAWHWPSWTPWVAAAAATISTIILAFTEPSPAALAATSLLMAVGFAIFVLLWGSRAALFGGGSIEVAIPVLFATAQTLVLLLHFVDESVSRVLIAAFPLCSALLYHCRPQSSEAGRSAPASAPLSVQRPLPPLSLRACAAAAAILLLFRLWYGTAASVVGGLRSESEVQLAMRLVLTILLFALIVYAALAYAQRVDVSLAVCWIVPSMLVTFAFLHFEGSLGISGAAMANNVLSPCTQAFFYILFAKAAYGNERRGVFLFSCYLMGLGLGTAAGYLIGSIFIDSLSAADRLLALSTILAIVGSTIFPLLRKAQLLGDTRDGSPRTSQNPHQDTADLEHSEDLSGPPSPARKLAQQFELSAREEEVLALLLMGRNRPYIRDALFISINTVNTHTRRIYAKTGVHSQQELIDLAYPEAERPNSRII